MTFRLILANSLIVCKQWQQLSTGLFGLLHNIYMVNSAQGRLNIWTKQNKEVIPEKIAS